MKYQDAFFLGETMRHLFSIYVVSLFFVSCISTTNPRVEPKSQDSPFKEIITNAPVFLSFDNVPNSFWHDEERKTSLCLNVFIYIPAYSLPIQIVEKISVIDFTGQNWNISTNRVNSKIGSWHSLNTNQYSFNRSVLLLNEYTIVFYMKGGAVYTKKINPQLLIKNSDYNTQSFIYSEDYNGRISSNYYKGLVRPSIKNHTQSDGNLTLSFSVNDPRIKNGIIYFYTNDKKHIGQTSFFYNSYSDQYVGFLNNGTAINTDGKENNITLNKYYIDFSDDYKFSDIKSLVIELSDQNNPDWYSIDYDTVILTSKSEMLFL